MRKSRFSEEQIIKILEQGRAGIKIEELCRPHSSLRGQTPSEVARDEKILTGTSI